MAYILPGGCQRPAAQSAARFAPYPGGRENLPESTVVMSPREHESPYLVSLAHPGFPVPCPATSGTLGTSMVTQKLWVDITTDANGDARFITLPLLNVAYVHVNPTTGVHTPTAHTDAVALNTGLRSARNVHHSCLFTYYGNPDDAAGIVSVYQSHTHGGLSTWNQDADVLGRNPQARSMKVATGFYAFTTDNGEFLELFNFGWTSTMSTPNGFGTGHIIASISGATPSTTIGRVEITHSWEVVAEDQLFPHKRYLRNWKDYFVALQYITVMPQIYKGTTWQDDVEKALDDIDALIRNKRARKRLLSK